ncbi:hypothetical protein QWY84_12885 [Aquisalimonas lutea]|uniref:ankyrin repeat domain-containing protein n=1 Tax=Aquisalimonas lutea TaxID=1327750 RepID=UPI0025B3AEE8|nr:ankyrin repeat domain-containing protein [Aquisalimonas lutea]MDN3518510.1 hypothetical protein [Aquisalimonas lutea]
MLAVFKQIVSLLLLVLTVSCCSAESVAPDRYGVGPLSKAIADYVIPHPGMTEADRENNEAVVQEVERLIRAGAKVNHQRPDTGATPLHEAVLYNSPELVRVLLDAGARLDIEDTSAEAREAGVGNLAPLEYARFVQRKIPNRDYSEVIGILARAKRNRQ